MARTRSTPAVPRCPCCTSRRAWYSRYRGAETINQHKALLECALKRDIKGAKTVLTEHINGCVAHALASWNED